jgi:hypothetical protein
MVRLGELMMILELHRQGVSITAIARRTGRDPKTVRKYIERGIEAPAYGPRSVGRPCKLASFMQFLNERVMAFPDLSAARLTREIRELGYAGAYTAVKRVLSGIPCVGGHNGKEGAPSCPDAKSLRYPTSCSTSCLPEAPPALPSIREVCSIL